MKEELFQLYLAEHPAFLSVVNRFPQDDLAGPFLVSPAEHYSRQRFPLLVVGPETNGWSRHVNELEKQMHAYESYNVGLNQGRTAFWNIIRKVEDLLGNEQCSCAWTNLSRFDLYGGKPHGEYSRVISRLDGLILKEIEILSPKVCVFFTGPDYDLRIRKIFPEIEMIEIPGWDPKQLVLLKHPTLPVYTFRSYHPRSLKLRRLEGRFIQTLNEFIIGGLTIN